MEKFDEIYDIMLSEVRGLHHLSLTCRRKALAHESNPEKMDVYARMAVRSASQVIKSATALHRYKSGNTQVIKVEKVYVGDGGQAIVGGVQVNPVTEATLDVNKPKKASEHKEEPIMYTHEKSHQELQMGTIDFMDEYSDHPEGGCF